MLGRWQPPRAAALAFRLVYSLPFGLQDGRNNDLRETSAERFILRPPDDWDAFFRARAQGASKAAFDLLAKGPPRTDRIPRRLQGGGETDIYGAILFAIAATGPVTTIEYD